MTGPIGFQVTVRVTTIRTFPVLAPSAEEAGRRACIRAAGWDDTESARVVEVREVPPCPAA